MDRRNPTRTHIRDTKGYAMIRIVAPLFALGLAACANDAAPLSPDFGNAVRHNMAVHTLNPGATYGADVAPTSGAHLGTALNSYFGREGAPPPTQILTLVPTTGGN